MAGYEPCYPVQETELSMSRGRSFKDPEFLADSQRARLDLNPINGEELEKIVARTVTLEPNLVARLKEILK